MWATLCLRNIILNFFSLGCSLFFRNNKCKKTQFSRRHLLEIYWWTKNKLKKPYHYYFCWTANRQTFHSVWSQNQIPENLSCLLSQRKIEYTCTCRAVIWEPIVYISYCDLKHNMRIDRASQEIPLNTQKRCDALDEQKRDNNKY